MDTSWKNKTTILLVCKLLCTRPIKAVNDHDGKHPSKTFWHRSFTKVIETIASDRVFCYCKLQMIHTVTFQKHRVAVNNKDGFGSFGHHPGE